MADKLHTKDRLAAELEAIGLPAMAEKARAGIYDDYLSPHGDNMAVLLRDLMEAALPRLDESKAVAILSLRNRVIDGDFDGTTEESEAWAASPDGQRVMRELARSSSKRPKK